jgi:serine/threonine protein kinase/tetratricopeptide (TPR) repeat protein
MTEATPEPDLPLGTDLPTLPGYRIVRELGRGGMATVYLAIQESLGREVALKLLTRRLAEDPSAAQRFVREARTAARLVHRHIVGVHEVGEHAGQPYLAMEYLPGDTIAGGPLPPAQALEITREIALALDHAHRQGVVHRDIKPENILRRADGSCALADFGIARTADGGGGMTQDGVTLGTPHYMSPEQLQGKELDGRSDLYSLGVVLYQLLTGEVPYKGTDGWAVGMQHISAPLPTLPPALARYQPLIDALMAKDPARRPQTGANAARLVESALGASGSAPTLALRMPPPAGARMPRRALGTLILLVALGGLGWLAWTRMHSPAALAAPASPAPTPARATRSIAVLPFANLSGDAANEYFSDGLAETTLDMLAQLKDLKVIARTSSFSFKGKDADSRDIGQALGAANLLRGSVQQAGDTVRITVQLIRAADGAQLWSRKFDRKLTDVFKVQDEIASAVVEALQVALPASEQQRLLRKRTDNVAAYREYLKGNALMPGRRVPEMREAAAHFEKAIALDPAYAQAYVAAHDAYLLLATYATVSAEERARGSRYLAKALELAPDLGEAHVARGADLEAARNLAEAKREFELGLKLAPGYASGFQWYAEFLAQSYGDFEASIPVMERAHQLDPLSPIIRDQRISTYALTGRVDEALALSNAFLAANPNVARGYDTRSILYTQKGDMLHAMRDLVEQDRRDPASVGYRSHRCLFLMDLSQLAAADRCLDALEALSPGSDQVRAARIRALGLRGDWGGALALARGLRSRDPVPVAVALHMLGRNAEAMAIFTQFAPPSLLQAKPVVGPPYGQAAIAVGDALMQTGQAERGRTLIRAGIAALEGRPYFSVAFGQGWQRAEGYELLGERDMALAALKEGVDAGFFLELSDLDANPRMAALRTDPRYASTLAPARRRLAAEIAKLRTAGLL